MKSDSIGRKAFFIFLLFWGVFICTTFAQTAGTLTFSSGTFAPNSDYGTKHVLAVWLENTASPSVFIKTKAKYGNEDDHLTSWTAKSNSNLVDAVSAATLASYGTISGSWNGTNVAGTVVPDGNYKLFIEMGWGRDKIGAHAVSSYNFTKGISSQHLTPTATANFMNVVIDWTPISTLIGAIETHDNVNVYPNPSTGMITVNFINELENASIAVTNLSGKTMFSQRGIKIPAGPKLIDLSDHQNGLYFISIQSKDLSYNDKILVNK